MNECHSHNLKKVRKLLQSEYIHNFRAEELSDEQAAGAVPGRHERRPAAVPRGAAHPRHALQEELEQGGPRVAAHCVPELWTRAGPALVGRHQRERQEDLPHLPGGDRHRPVEDWQ